MRGRGRAGSLELVAPPASCHWKCPARSTGKLPQKMIITLDCIGLHCIGLHSIALDGLALHWIALDCIGLHWIALHWIALDCIALDCIGSDLNTQLWGRKMTSKTLPNVFGAAMAPHGTPQREAHKKY